jgi:hypothetical protein
MPFRQFHKLKAFAYSKKAQEAYHSAKRYTVFFFNVIGVMIYGATIYVLDALNNLRIQARKEPFIALAALATIVYAVFAYAQWQVMGGQLAIMRSQLAVTKSQLQARMKRELGIDAVAENGIITGWRLTPVWENVGATEAINFVGWNALNVFRPDVPQDFDFLHAKPPDRVPVTVENGQTILQATIRISVTDATDAIAGHAKIIAWGYGEYLDIFFPDTPMHHKHWCVELLPLKRGNEIRFSEPIIYKQECNQSD